MNPNKRSYTPRLIAWEITRRCHLKCKHCRAAAADIAYENEFTTDEIKKTLRNIAAFSKPVIILTGGEPMMRDDIYDIASYGNSLGLKMVMAPCGKFVTPDSVRKMKESGILRISLSIDGRSAKSHDDFRGLVGSFDDVIKAAKTARSNGMPFQINTTVTKANEGEIEDILNLAISLGAVSFHPFLLVPTGRGKEMTHLELKSEEYEELLKKVSQLSQQTGMHVKPTCAPHYFRIQRQASSGHKAAHGHGGFDSMSRGCMGGTGFAFISHTGRVQICGFMDVECGDIRKSEYNFEKIWNTSDVFKKMRTPGAYNGKCAICEYHNICGGCRARAYASTGDYMASEPYCAYEPKNKSLSQLDRLILNRLQDFFPITHDPFSELANEFGISSQDVMDKIIKWKEMGLIRRLSATINTSSLGFKSALVALCVDNDSLDGASGIIAAHPGVSHSYLRDHHYNVWFTIKVPPGFDLNAHVEKISRLSKANHHLILPSIKNYKLDVRFDFIKMKGAHIEASPRPSKKSLSLTDRDMLILKELNRGLPLTFYPFEEMSLKLGLKEETLLSSIRGLSSSGVIDKFKFALNHIFLGIASNSMVVWDIEDDRKDEVGKLFAAKDYISHCYERVKYKEFPYSIYTMIHSTDKKNLNDLVNQLVKEISPRSFCRLDTLKELTKCKASLSKEDYEALDL